MKAATRNYLALVASGVLITAASPVAGAIDSVESAPPIEENSELPESSFIDEALKSSGPAEDSQEAASMAEEASKLPPLSSVLLGSGDHIGDQYTAFYHDPVDLDSSEPGQLFRSESVRNPKNPLGISNVGPYKADRILYSSTNRSGEKIQVSGMVIEPKTEWGGEGPRPVVAFAPGTQGLADRCAASRKIADGVGDYEQFYFHQYLKKGYAVVLTDYEGLGTPGMHTYMDRASQGHTVLDSIRAAQQLDGWDINESNPVFINGYSQGGGAAAAAAELYDDYAPELNIKLATIGAAPTDLTLLPSALDGSLYFLFEAYALLGLSNSYGEDLYSHLNDRGTRKLQDATNTCTMGLLKTADTTVERISNDGRNVQDFIDSEPFKSILAEQHIGYDAPAIPVVITHGRGDDVIPFSTAEKLVDEWTERGTDVTFIPNNAHTHPTGTIPHIIESVKAIDATLQHEKGSQ